MHCLCAADNFVRQRWQRYCFSNYDDGFQSCESGNSIRYLSVLGLTSCDRRSSPPSEAGYLGLIRGCHAFSVTAEGGEETDDFTALAPT
jgi:hypothetical protein